MSTIHYSAIIMSIKDFNSTIYWLKTNKKNPYNLESMILTSVCCIVNICHVTFDL